VSGERRGKRDRLQTQWLFLKVIGSRGLTLDAGHISPERIFGDAELLRDGPPWCAAAHQVGGLDDLFGRQFDGAENVESVNSGPDHRFWRLAERTGFGVRGPRREPQQLGTRHASFPDSFQDASVVGDLGRGAAWTPRVDRCTVEGKPPTSLVDALVILLRPARRLYAL
jgi:hypothetical protein